MIWNTTSDERLLATTWTAPNQWNAWQRADLDGFGLPFIGSLLGMLPSDEDVLAENLEHPASDNPQRMTLT